MGRYLAQRLLHAIFVIWGAATLVFLILHLSPGDPAVNLVGENATGEQFEMVRRSLGLDRPLHERYLVYVSDLVQGDLGRSWFVGQPTLDMLLERIPDTIELTVVAALVGIPLAIALGVVSAVWRRTPLDYGASTIALLGVSTPNFWLGVMLILLFAVELRWLPAIGRGPSITQALAALLGGDGSALRQWARHIALPAVTLGTFLMALLVVAILGPKITNIILVMGGVGWIWHARIVRGNALRIREEQYVLAAVDVGTTRVGIMWRHVLPNLLAPVLVTATMQIGYMVILESGLSFFGITGTTLSWGWDISAGRKYLASAWWIASFPGFAIFFTVLSFNLLGDFLRDVVDPHGRHVSAG